MAQPTGRNQAQNKHELAEPFSQIFQDRAEAELAFDLLLETVKRLGLSSPYDERFALTLPRLSGKLALHLNFGRWLVLGFRGPGQSPYRVEMALLAKRVRWNERLDSLPFTRKEGEPEVRSYQLPFELIRPLTSDLRAAYDATLDFIADKFHTWKRTPYWKQHNSEIVEALFDTERRERLFAGGFDGELKYGRHLTAFGQPIGEDAEIYDADIPVDHLDEEIDGAVTSPIDLSLPTSDEAMKTITVDALDGIESDFQEVLFEAMRNRSNRERMLVCLYFMSNLPDESHNLDQIEKNLRKIFPPSLGEGKLPDEYKDFRASMVRGSFSAENRAVKDGRLSKEERLWTMTGRGHWRNTALGNQRAREILQEEGVQLLVAQDRMIKEEIDVQYSGNSFFTPKTFELLSDLHENPTKDFYMAHKEEFKTYVEEPFQQLFQEVASRLPPQITDVMETEKRTFARFLKNDFGQGGAWDFYWGAFYPKGGKRTNDAQLSMWINYERFEFGFYIGDYGSEVRKRYLRNCQENYSVLRKLLGDVLSDEKVLYGGHEDFTVAPDGSIVSKINLDWEEWLRDPDKGNFDVSVILTRRDVLRYSAEELTEQIGRTFINFFPLILLAINDEPLPVISEYLGLSVDDEDEFEINPEYPLPQLAEETGFDEAELTRWERAIERKKQAILYGPPGTGKTFIAEKLAGHLIGGGDGFRDLVQFHPAYAYEDFIQGIRPESKGGELSYPLVKGRFLEFCEEARRRQGRCVLIIDEINRANLARVFGELMYLLEYRNREIPLAGGGTLKIPANVRLIGTMNTADRSIALVDHALRRRFAFLALYPNYEILRRFHRRQETGFPVDGLIDILKRLNERIDDKHYAVGITFFLYDRLEEQIEDIWRMEIEPYLEEYFFDRRETVEDFRWDKIASEVLP